MHFGLPQNRQRVFLLGTRSATLESDTEDGRVAATRLAPREDLRRLSAHQLEDLSNTRAWQPIVQHGKRFPSWGLARQGRFIGADIEFSLQSPPIAVKTFLDPVRPFFFLKHRAHHVRTHHAIWVEAAAVLLEFNPIEMISA